MKPGQYILLSCTILLLAATTYWLYIFRPFRNISEQHIVLQPLGNFPDKEAAWLLENIRITHPNSSLRTAIPFPPSAYYPSRQRYRADTILRYLRQAISGDTVIIGLSQKDISTSKNGKKDWGVMGLGYMPGKACVVSTFRLAKSNQREQFHKVVLHEFGHTQGLPHCLEKTCFMRDAEGGNPLDEETGFCNQCSSRLHHKCITSP